METKFPYFFFLTWLSKIRNHKLSAFARFKPLENVANYYLFLVQLYL